MPNRPWMMPRRSPPPSRTRKKCGSITQREATPEYRTLAIDPCRADIPGRRINVHHGEALDHYGMEKISMEQLFLYDPQVILVKEKAFFRAYFNDPRGRTCRRSGTNRSTDPL